MTRGIVTQKANRITTFEDLRGLRAEGYVRDSTLDQRDGFGPDIQRHNEERFAQSYGLVLGNRWYTEFVSGRRAAKRHEFRQGIEDARLDRFDVLLVDHTSRFGRNQAECIRYKEELRSLGKTVIFVSQGIISGSDRDFLSERINETLDEQYSRNLSRYVSAGLAEKVNHGLHIGPPPLGYKSELVSGKRERKVPDPTTMPALLMALRDYATGELSYIQVADRLNAQGFRLREGGPFKGFNIRDVLDNRFYEGKVVYHQGLPDEQVFEGSHEVPAELKDLWVHCQEIKKSRRVGASGRPCKAYRVYPFSRVLRCSNCGNPYHGEAIYNRGKTDLRLIHERHSLGRSCPIRPRTRTVDSVCEEFGERVLSQVHLDDSWKSRVVAALRDGHEPDDYGAQRDRLSGALERLRKQHLWGDVSDDDYRRDRASLEQQLKAISRDRTPPQLPNLERAAILLNDLPALWSHPGVTSEQREAMIREVYTRISIDGDEIASVEPKPAYAPLFAVMLAQDSLGYCDLESSSTSPLR